MTLLGYNYQIIGCCWGTSTSTGSYTPARRFDPPTHWDTIHIRIHISILGLCNSGNSLITIMQLSIMIITIKVYIYEVYQSITIKNQVEMYVVSHALMF